MNCQEVIELMQRQLDDDLDPSEMEVLMNHTRHCPDCASMFERLKLLSAELTALPKVTPSYSLVDAIMPKLERIELFGDQEAAALPTTAARTPQETARRVKRKRWPSMRVLSGVIAAGIVAGLFLVTYKPEIAPDLTGAGLFSANDSSSAADTASSVEPQEFSFKAKQSDEMSFAPEVETETMNTTQEKQDEQAYDGISTHDTPAPVSPTEKTDGSESRMGKSDANAGADASSEEPAPESVAEGDVNGLAVGESDSSDGSAGALGVQSNGNTHHVTEERGLTAAEAGAASPDGKYYAQAEDFAIKVYASSDQSTVLETKRKNGSIANLSWTEDSAQLTYEVHMEQGSIEKYVIDLASGEDRKAAQ
ncbi:zf-HC2 domain-containing protein [Paenibacillus sp. sgz302251]|uniref:anti-sigma factor family protein n=1 Tax=Paenibacillus sp. sgz302251 TaxID=3414493 RepID=UPI003C7C3B1D